MLGVGCWLLVAGFLYELYEVSWELFTLRSGNVWKSDRGSGTADPTDDYCYRLGPARCRNGLRDNLPRDYLQWNDLLPDNHLWDNIPQDIALQDNLLCTVGTRSSLRLRPCAAIGSGTKR